MAKLASESGHWYSADGTPHYTVIGKNGNERPTNIRDAKELNLRPGATTIIRCAAAPGLEAWKRNQTLLAALTLPIRAGETEEAWLERVRIDQDETGRKAAERGTLIHAAIEKYYRGEPQDAALAEFGAAAAGAIGQWCGTVQEWAPERSFAYDVTDRKGDSYGYGGKVDLHSAEWVIDFKTKEFRLKDRAPGIFDEHLMQLAAYRRGLQVPKARCAIVYVSSIEPGTATVIELSEEELRKGLQMFDALLSYWYIKTGLTFTERA